MPILAQRSKIAFINPQWLNLKVGIIGADPISAAIVPSRVWVAS